MPKFFDDPEIRLWRINENRWFEIHQDLLLWMANTKAGRDLLCIPQEYGPIFLFKKNCVHFLHDNALKADFRIGAKWANVIRYRWQEFNAYARYFPTRDLSFASPLTRSVIALSAATLTAYPDPDPETTTVDGQARCDNETSWDNAHNETNSSGGAASSNGTRLNCHSRAYNSVLVQIQRAFILFDTSSLTSAASISAADVQLNPQAENQGTDDESGDEDNDAQGYVTVIGNTTPASNTTLVTGDFDGCGAVDNPTKMTDDVDLTGIATNTYVTWTCNATGLANISKTGITKWGIREGHDIEDVSIGTSDQRNGLSAHSAETTGTSEDPKLTVTYTTATSTIYLPILGVG